MSLSFNEARFEVSAIQHVHNNRWGVVPEAQTSKGQGSMLLGSEVKGTILNYLISGPTPSNMTPMATIDNNFILGKLRIAQYADDKDGIQLKGRIQLTNGEITIGNVQVNVIVKASFMQDILNLFASLGANPADFKCSKL